MAKAKTKEEKLKEKIDNILKHVRQHRETALSIAKDSAVKVADNLNREDEKGIKERNAQFIDYRAWRARAAAYEEVEKIIINELQRY